MPGAIQLLIDINNRWAIDEVKVCDYRLLLIFNVYQLTLIETDDPLWLIANAWTHTHTHAHTHTHTHTRTRTHTHTKEKRKITNNFSSSSCSSQYVCHHEYKLCQSPKLNDWNIGVKPLWTRPKRWAFAAWVDISTILYNSWNGTMTLFTDGFTSWDVCNDWDTWIAKT